MQKIYTLTLLLLCVSLLTAQDPCASLNFHAFKAESLAGQYTDLGNQGTKIEVSNLDDGNSEPQDIGFDFVYQCQSFSQFIFNTNGFIKLGTETTPKNSLFFSDAQSTNGGVFNNPDSNNVNLIAVFSHDIETISANPDFRVHTSGTAPDRVCTIQWKNMQEWSSDPATKQYIDINFQLRLYETTHVIEFVYGEWGPASNYSNYKTAACGLKGKSNEDDQLLVVVKSSAAHWDRVSFHNGNYAPNESFNFGAPPDRPKPDAGRTYRFTPTYLKDLSMKELYTLGDASYYYSSPQHISASVMNAGFTTQYDIPVILDISGANMFRDTQYISQLAFGEKVRVNFTGFNPSANGMTSVRVTLGDDDAIADNVIEHEQRINDFDLNYSCSESADKGYGFPSGGQGVYFVKYPINGTARVEAVNAFIAIDSTSIDKTVFATLLDAGGVVVARSENYIIQESDLGTWHTFSVDTPPVFTDSEFYAGLGMMSSLTEYAALGVQEETPLRPGAYYKSLITGNGLQPMDTIDFGYRFMIGVALSGTAPAAGPATGDTTICAYGTASIALQQFTGFITWQSSPDGINGWQAVPSDEGSHSAFYITPPLTTSLYFRAAVFQPGFGVAFSNAVFVEVVPPTPVISASGDILSSSAAFGNQWYDENGPIPGATDQHFLALAPGKYYVVVTSIGCTSAPSNSIELLTVSTDGPHGPSPIIVYPNPMANELFVDVSSIPAFVDYQMINSQGIIVYNGKLTGLTRINTDQMTPGFYLLKIELPGNTEIIKLIKN